MELKVNSLKHGEKIILIDEDDYYKLKLKKPYLSLVNNYFYGYIYYDNKNIAIHRLVTDCPRGMIVDHINHNTLDNRKENLRICTHQENMRNSFKNKNLTSKYKGVSWHKDKKRYRVQLTIDGKCKEFGLFKNEIDAAKKYNQLVSSIYGEFAVLNIIDEVK